MLTDVEIAARASPRPIEEIGEALGLAGGELEPYGRFKAKVPLDVLRDRDPGSGRLVLVTGVTPTRAGEGKTTVSVGLADGLRRLGRRSVLCIREPSLGPVFGIKGGAAGGGHSQVIPMADINLHFTGDLHAITSAHGLLSALVDNHLHQGNELGIEPRRVTWRRALDMNDRALRDIVVGLGGPTAGVPRQDGFMITAASEVMAILCLAADLGDLEARLGRIIVAYTRDGDPVRAADVRAPGAMTLLLRDALSPNLVQTLEGTPSFVHGGPFANIAHGCNSLVATRGALALGDIVVTEAGFGSDLGAEKFFDIKCRAGSLRPGAAVIVATARALKLHGGAPPRELAEPDPDALVAGLPNLEKHVENVRRFGVAPVVAINRFEDDSHEELAALESACAEMGVRSAISEGHARGGEGCEELAEAVLATLEAGEDGFSPLYPLEMSLEEKLATIARAMYGAEGVDYTPGAREDLDRLEELGMGSLPVCVAKTPSSLSDDPGLLGRPEGFHITVQDLRPSAGAGFVVARTGTIMVLPGLPKRPSAEEIRVEADGRVVGLF